MREAIQPSPASRARPEQSPEFCKASRREAPRWSDEPEQEQDDDCSDSLSVWDASGSSEIPSTPEAPSRQVRCDIVLPKYLCACSNTPPPPEHDADASLQLDGTLPPSTSGWPCHEQWFEVPWHFHEHADWNQPSSSATHELLWYVVTFISGIDIRTHPDVDGPRTGIILPQHTVFSVSDVVRGRDGRVYLRLADGRGWVFDDSSHFPSDPSVRQLPPAQKSDMHVPPPPPPVQSGLLLDYSHLFMEQLVPVRHWKRGKRGGAKRRKRGGVKHRPRSEA